MRRRHPSPTAWLITDERLEPGMLQLIAGLPRGTGVLVRHHGLARAERARLLRKVRGVGSRGGLIIVDEACGQVARVHSAREIAKSRLAGARLLFISPLFGTRSHPDWRPLPRMKAAALARLAGNRPVALGGMDEKRFRRIAEPLGFRAWAAIDGWMRRKKPPPE